MTDNESITSQESLHSEDEHRQGEPSVDSTFTSIPIASDMDRLSRPASPQEPEPGCLGTAMCDPRRSLYRFEGLIFMCFLGFGSYFVYDTPASLQNEIKADMQVSTYEYQSLYFLYSWPNVLMCFVGGFLIDRVFGIRMGAIIFATVVTVGHYIYALGAYLGHFWLMQLGRFIFGLGGENLSVTTNTYAVSWFQGKELNFVFGLQLSMARVGSTVNFYVMEPVYELVASLTGEPEGYENLGLALFIAGGTCVFSLLCALVMGAMDRRRSNVLHLEAGQTNEKIQLRDILSFPLSFWLISVICVFFYSAVFPFVSVSKVFFMYKYELDAASADFVAGIPYIVSAFVSPLLGFMVDRVGRNILWVFLACVSTMVAHLMLAFSFMNPYIPMVLMGITYSLLASSLWPMVSLILPNHQLGTGYGIMQSIQNLGLALMAMLSGFMVDNYGYLMLEVFNVLSLAVAVGGTAGIYIIDAIQNDGYLFMSATERPLEPPSVVRREARRHQLAEEKRNAGNTELANPIDRKENKTGGKSFLARQLSDVFRAQRSSPDARGVNVLGPAILEETTPDGPDKFEEIFGDLESVKECKSGDTSVRSSIFKDSGRRNVGFEGDSSASSARSSTASRRTVISRQSSVGKGDNLNVGASVPSVSKVVSDKYNEKVETMSMSSRGSNKSNGKTHEH